MEKIKRSERIALILQILAQQPNTMHTFSEFSERFGCAKSTLSEDMTSLREVLEHNGLGRLETVPGAAGGIRYLPFANAQMNRRFVLDVCELLCDKARMMPGGYLYTFDVFSNPHYIKKLGEILAQSFYKQEPDVVVTVESKGIPVGLMVAQSLGVPLIVARKENRLTEGPVVTLNYVSAGMRRLQTMSLPRRALVEGQRALIIDDFVKGGGTVGALCEMMKEFSCGVVGIGSIIGPPQGHTKRGHEVRSLITLHNIDEEAPNIVLKPAVWL